MARKDVYQKPSPHFVEHRIDRNVDVEAVADETNFANDFEKDYDRNELAEALEKAMSVLTPRQKAVIENHFNLRGKEKNGVVNWSTKRRALKIMHDSKEANVLKPFLGKEKN